MAPVVDLRDKLSLFSEHWSPKVVATMNDYEVKVAKVKGEFVWHSHADTDELFLVVDGTLTIRLPDGEVTLGPGQLFVVPRGVEHCPVAADEASIVLIEPAGVVNTGEAGGDLTATHDTSLLDDSTAGRSGAAGAADGRRPDDPGALVEHDRLAGGDAPHALVEHDPHGIRAVDRRRGGHLRTVGAHLGPHAAPPPSGPARTSAGGGPRRGRPRAGRRCR